MDIKDFIAGTYKPGYHYQYFQPDKINHPFFWADADLNELLEKASYNLGALNSFSRFVPDTNMYIIMHIFKEAVVSSRIEGTRTNIEEALFSENEITFENRNDWVEVNNYVKAMNYAIDELRNLPLSNRLLKETHKLLLQSVRGEHRCPGEFRNSQNWIGGATLKDAVFIPPAHDEVPELMSDLEKFLHNQDIKVPDLIRIAIAHYQFETIHPFLDGNGRIGRLLITLYLVSKQILEKPLLYLSEFFEKNKGLYYDNLTFTRTKNDLRQWLKFFLVAVIETAEQAMVNLKKIVDLKHSIEDNKLPNLGKRLVSGKTLFNALFSKPVVYIKDITTITGLSLKAANDLAAWFEANGILKETTGLQRNRIFTFDEYIRLFE